VLDPSGTTAGDSKTTANVADATEAPTFQALFTQSTYPGAIQMLEGKNSMLNQMVYDIIQGRYGGPSQTSLADSLSKSLSASMVEQARLFNLFVQYVNQDQPQASDSKFPLSQLPMDLRQEERASRGNKRVLSEIDISEWEITCKETRPREGKQRCDTGKATPLPVCETLSQAARLRKKKKKKLCLIKKDQQQISEPGDLPPCVCYNCRQPRHFILNCPNIQHQDQNLRTVKCARGKNPIFQGKPDQLDSMGNISIQEPLPRSLL
jgi:hypothetical protein